MSYNGVIQNNLWVDNKSSWWNESEKKWNDDCWFIPYVAGDLINFQFQFNIVPMINCWNTTNTLTLTAHKCCDDTLLTDIVNPSNDYFFGVYSTKDKPWLISTVKPYQMAVFNGDGYNFCNVCNSCVTRFKVRLSLSQFYGDPFGRFFQVKINGVVYSLTSLPAGWSLIVDSSEAPEYYTLILEFNSCCDGCEVGFLILKPDGESYDEYIGVKQEICSESAFDKCFYFKTTYNQETEYLTQPYKCVACEDTVLLEGEFECFDMDGTYHGYPAYSSPPVQIFCGTTPEIKYRNILRVRGVFQQDGTKITKKYSSENCFTYGAEKQSFFKLYTEIMPIWYADMVMNLLTAKRIKVNGFYYQIEGDVSTERVNVKGVTGVRIIADFVKCKQTLEFGCNNC